MKTSRNSSIGLALAIAASTGFAANIWDGDVSSDWGTGTNWDDGNVPATGADLTFPGTGVSSYTVDLGNVNRDFRSMTFSNSTSTPYTFQNGTLRTTVRNIDFLTNNGSADVIVNAALTWISHNNARRITGTGTGDVYLNGSISGDMGISNTSSDGLVHLFINGNNSAWSGNNAVLSANANNNITLGHVNALGSARLSMGGAHGINASTDIVSDGALAISGGSVGATVTFFGSNYSFGSGSLWPRNVRLSPQSNTVTIRGLFAAAQNIHVNGNATGRVVLDGAVTLGFDNWDSGIFVEGGSLLINGSQTVTVAQNFVCSVNPGATLGGTGNLQLGGTATITGIVAPGADGAGTLTFGTNASTGSGTSLSLADGATYRWEAQSTTSYDKIVVDGGLTLPSGTINLKLANLGSVKGGEFTILTWSGADPANSPTWNIDYGSTEWSDATVTVDNTLNQVVLTIPSKDNVTVILLR